MRHFWKSILTVLLMMSAVQTHSVSRVIGNVCFSNDLEAMPAGMYDVPLSLSRGAFNPLPLKIAIDAGCSHGDRYYAVNSNRFGTYIFMMKYAIYDINTWEEIASWDKTTHTEFLPEEMAYNPVDGLIYGNFFSSNGREIEFGCFDPENPTERRTISRMDGQRYDMVAISPEGVIYVINDVGVLKTVDADTGSETVIGETGLKAHFMGSGCYDAENERIIYANFYSEHESRLYTINPLTSEATFLYDVPYEAEIYGLGMAPQYFPDNVPGLPTEAKLTLTDPEMAGTLSFRMPEMLYDDSAAEGDAAWRVIAGDETLAEGHADYGAAVSTAVTFPYDGLYTVTIEAENAAGTGPGAELTRYVGYDTPGPIAEVNAEYANGVLSVNWAAVTAGAHEGYFLPGEVRYNVVGRMGDRTYTIATDIAATNASLSLEMPSPPEVMTVEVATVYRGKTFEPATTQLLIGELEPPLL